ncbi:uncharacterized protein LOC108745008 [Agrilus planipennis]|uniref:protein-tyrosine-phosphatase n=1 Tax=Agrilus planipennis TaxID=224129 RepID=A0A1W4XK80_AGRPL|nr:uncharacterized protein LOC108745008 [Agrilus planipennis]
MEASHYIKKDIVEVTKKERNFPSLDLSTTSTLTENTNQPILLIQSPKTPTLSRKLKAVSLDSDPTQKSTLEVSRDVFSVPNTPKKQLKPVSIKYNDDRPFQTASLTSDFHSVSNLKKFTSNSNISGSQLLKTLPEIMTLQDFSDSRPEPVRIKTKGLLERRGSNASLTIDLGSTSRTLDTKVMPLKNFNNIKSVSHINLSTVGVEKCSCSLPSSCEVKANKKAVAIVGRCSGTLQKSQPQLDKIDINPIKTSSPEGKTGVCKNRCYTFHKKCNCLCNFKCRRKSLSNENLYIPPCSFCQSRNGPTKCGTAVRHCKGCKKTVYPRQAGLCQSQALSEDFKLHLQNVQYLQTAGSVLSLTDLKMACEPTRVPKLHQEFWEVPLNLQEKCIVSGSQNKNRYKGVLPNEHSRVHLLGERDYIHANYIKGPDYLESCYIATQGPMSHTCEDFWEMVWNNKSNCIVMLTGLVEKGRNKCELYFPLGRTSPNSREKSFYYVTTTKVQDRFTFDFKNTKKYEEETVAFEELDEVTYGNFRIKFINKFDLGHYSLRLLELFKLDSDGDVRKIYHYWYSKWQDHKMASPEEVLELALDVLTKTNKIDGNERSKNPNDTISDNNISRKSSLDNNNLDSVSKQRPKNSQDLISNNAKNNTSEDTRKISKALRTSNWHKELAKLQEEMEEIKQNLLKKSQSALDYFTSSKDLNETSSKIENFSKKTNTNIFFSLKTRSMAQTESFDFDKTSKEEAESSYNNNLKVNNTEKNSEDETAVVTKISPRDHGNLKFKSVSTNGDSSEIFLRNETVSRPFSSKISSDRDSSSDDFQSADSLSLECDLSSSLLPKKFAELPSSTIVVHCSAGIGRTGCFLAVLNGIQQLRNNRNVDVLAILCSLRLNRGGMVQTAEQYELIHRVLKLYAETLL